MKFAVRRAMVRLIEPITEVTEFLDQKMSHLFEERLGKFETRVQTVEECILPKKTTMKTKFG